MSILESWRARHPMEPAAPGRVIVLILLLAAVIFFILKSDTIANGFTFFLHSGSTGAETTE
jgi:putative effector of murein hydrolase LrgA (UPF0299 family)